MEAGDKRMFFWVKRFSDPLKALTGSDAIKTLNLLMSEKKQTAPRLITSDRIRRFPLFREKRQKQIGP